MNYGLLKIVVKLYEYLDIQYTKGRINGILHGIDYASGYNCNQVCAYEIENTLVFVTYASSEQVKLYKRFLNILYPEICEFYYEENI